MEQRMGAVFQAAAPSERRPLGVKQKKWESRASVTSSCTRAGPPGNQKGKSKTRGEGGCGEGRRTRPSREQTQLCADADGGHSREVTEGWRSSF